MSDIYLAISETPTVVTLTSAVLNSAVASSVTVMNTVTVALDANSLSALENVTVTVGAAITGTVTIGNSVTVSSLPAISGTVTVGNSVVISSLPAIRINPNYDGQGGNNGPVVEADSDIGSDPRYMVFAGGADNTSGEFRALTFDTSNALKVAGTVTVGNTVTIAGTVTANPTGTQTIAGSVTIGAGTAQIGSVTASISSFATSVTARLINPAGTSVTYAEVGTAGNPSIDVLSVQGVTAGTPLNVYPAQGTTVSNTNFTSTTASTSLVSAVTGREVLTVFNEGAGNLHISPGATATTISYQVRLSAGDYWECPQGQLSLAHSAIFATAGTARVTQVS